MTDSAPLHSLVLIGRYPGKDMAVAQALARCMGREESWGLRIVSSSPIVFFEKLSDKQARAIESALADVAKTGCRFEIQPGTNAALPKVGWATAPRINGLSLAEIAPGSDVHLAIPAPNLLAVSMPSPNQAGAPPAPSSAQPENVSHASTTLLIACPYTGQKIKLTLAVTLTRGDSGTALNITASAAPPVGRPLERSIHAASGTVILPTVAQLKQSGGSGQLRNSGANLRPAPGPEFGHNEIKARPPTTGHVLPSHPQSAPHAVQEQAWRRNTPAGNPLPDVPVLPLSNKAAARPASLERQPLPLESQPMDLSAFEASLGMESRRPSRPFKDSGQQHFSPSAADADTDENASSPENESELCSVFIERSSSPVVHELVAELHGIPESEASEMCVNGSVALAENIPLFEAKDIKLRCAAINVFARIVHQDR